MSAGAGKLIGAAAARRWTIDLGILVAIGLMMEFPGPVSSDHLPVAQRLVCWIICMVGCGLIVIVADELLRLAVAEETNINDLKNLIDDCEVGSEELDSWHPVFSESNA